MPGTTYKPGATGDYKTAYQRVLEALDYDNLPFDARLDRKLSVLCPAHDDNRESLSVGEGDNGTVLLYCHAGCDTKDVVAALGLEMKDLFDRDDRVLVAQYVYTDEVGNVLYRVLRYQPKGFAQQRWEDGEWKWGLADTRKVVYNLAEVSTAATDRSIYLCEGEKDADAATRLGEVATTLPGGAGKWRDEYSDMFRGRDVVVVSDNDDTGRQGASRVLQQLTGVARAVRLVVPSTGKDLSDHLQAGGTLETLVEEGDGLDEFGPLDWRTYEVEKTEWLLEPFVPRGGRVLAFGPAGSLKSLWAMWLAARVAHEGGRVAYFSLEMLPSTTAMRLKQLDPPADKFLCFTRNFRLGSPSHTFKLIEALRGYDLIVVDSWTSARSGAFKDSNEAVAELDTEVFLPIVKTTGAAVLVLDNTGHPSITDQGVFKMDHARGASAKGDKMDVCCWFDRPYSDNNFATKITIKKMRLDYKIPDPVVVGTPRDRIAFYYLDDKGNMTDRPMWPTDFVLPGRPSEETQQEQRAVARVKDLWAEKEET